MMSEERLRELVERILRELKAQSVAVKPEKKIYMLCTGQWDDRFYTYLIQMGKNPDNAVYPVIPLSWKKQGYEAKLLSCPSCRGILYRSCNKPEDLEAAVTVFPVVPRDVVVKTALCIGDTFETAWIFSCMESGGQVEFLRTGLAKFSGKESNAYKHQIISYHRQVLEYGIKICDVGEYDVLQKQVSENRSFDSQNDFAAVPHFPVPLSGTAKADSKKRVISASNVESLAVNGILHLSAGDMITDLAKDRAKLLNISVR